MIKIQSIIRKRYKYFLPFYIVAVIASIIGTGVPHWYYLIPVKILAICFMLVCGNGVYYIAEEKQQMFLAFFRTLKYLLFSLILLFFFAILQAILRDYGINILPLIGM